MGVTRDYHAFLRQQVPDAISNGAFSYSLAEATLAPYETAHWRQRLDFLTGPLLKKWLREAAEKEKILLYAPVFAPFITINFFKFPRADVRVVLAALILKHCLRHGVPGKFRVFEDRVEIRVATGPLGQALLMHKPGLKHRDIAQFCGECGVPTWGPFPWLPAKVAGEWTINPCAWPCNTPDVNEIAEQLI